MVESAILMIDDDPTLIEKVTGVARSVDHRNLILLPDIDRAYSYQAWDSVSLVIIHVKRRGPATDVTRLLRMISAARRPVPTLVIGEQFDPDQAMSLLRLGVADYLTLPLDVNWLTYLIRTLTIRSRPALPSEAIEAPRVSLPGAVDPAIDDGPPGADRLMAQVRRIAPQDTTILLSGETGTGKTRLAHLIHELSPRRPEPFQVINCGALSAGLIEDEMFGHVRGAFPGADCDRSGLFTEVGRGTLFLDEIETLPMPVQSKLLRVVEDRVFEPVGSSKSQPLRARLIAASNRALDQEVADGRFRSDLYYRINVIGFHLPPLRERRASIPTLVAKFIEEFAHRNGGEVDSISAGAMQLLERYDWPGNIRELRNLIERSVALCPGREIQVEDLPEAITRCRPGLVEEGHEHRAFPNHAADTHTTLAQIKQDAELARITEALQKHSNNRLRAASELGISRMTLYKKLYKYGLMQPNPSSRDGVA